MKHIRRLMARMDERGNAIIEFAFAGTLFMLLMLGAFELGFMLFVQSALDNAARSAARLIRTGQVQTSGNPTATFQTLLCNDVSSLIACGSISYQVQVFTNWTGAQTAMSTPVTRDKNGNMVSAGFTPGTQRQIQVVTVAYNYPFFTPFVGALLGGSSNSTLLMSTVVFQNEPYQ